MNSLSGDEEHFTGILIGLKAVLVLPLLQRSKSHRWKALNSVVAIGFCRVADKMIEAFDGDRHPIWERELLAFSNVLFPISNRLVGQSEKAGNDGGLLDPAFVAPFEEFVFCARD